MDIMPQDEAQELLEPHLPRLKEIFVTAWTKFGQIPTELSYSITPRSRACIVSDYICHEVRHKFDNVVGVSITDYPDFLVLNFYNLLLMRFKMLDECLRTSNVLTYRQKTYNDQDKQLELPSMPPLATRVVAGYQLDRVQANIKDALITCPHKNSIVWSFSFFGDEPGASQQVLPTDEPPMKGPKVKAKNIKKSSNE
jgi:hypothetical protein